MDGCQSMTIPPLLISSLMCLKRDLIQKEVCSSQKIEKGQMQLNLRKGYHFFYILTVHQLGQRNVFNSNWSKMYYIFVLLHLQVFTRIFQCFSFLIYLTMGQFFCVRLGSICYLSCLDSCLQTYVLRKIKTARFMLCLS